MLTGAVTGRVAEKLLKDPLDAADSKTDKLIREAATGFEISFIPHNGDLEKLDVKVSQAARPRRSTTEDCTPTEDMADKLVQVSFRPFVEDFHSVLEAIYEFFATNFFPLLFLSFLTMARYSGWIMIFMDGDEDEEEEEEPPQGWGQEVPLPGEDSSSPPRVVPHPGTPPSALSPPFMAPPPGQPPGRVPATPTSASSEAYEEVFDESPPPAREKHSAKYGETTTRYFPSGGTDFVRKAWRDSQVRTMTDSERQDRPAPWHEVKHETTTGPPQKSSAESALPKAREYAPPKKMPMVLLEKLRARRPLRPKELRSRNCTDA